MKPDYVRRALYAAGLTPTQRLILASLADMASDTGLAYPARSKLAAWTGLNPQVIGRNLTDLERLGYLTRTDRARPGRVLELTLHPARWPPRNDPRPQANHPRQPRRNTPRPSPSDPRPPPR